MTTYKFSNRASALLASSLTSTGLSATLQSGGGGLFPFLNVGEVAPGAIIAASGVVEYVTITAITGDVLTIQRAQEGTAASAFPAGSRLELRASAGVFNNFLQKSGGALTGPLDMQGNGVFNQGLLNNYSANIIQAQIYRNQVKPPDSPYDPNENHLIIPNDNSLPFIYGTRILLAGMFTSVVFAAFIDVNNVPFYFKLCDGSNGTPDLRRQFLRGWNPGEIPVGLRSGNDLNITSPNGNHDHGGSALPTLLNSSNLPQIVITAPQFDVQSGAGFKRVVSVTATYNDGTAQSHLHPIQFSGDHQHSVFTIPPFVTVAFVMLNIS